MCRPVTCTVCGKTTWAGCGQHVDQVKRTILAGNWCPGHDRAAAPASTRRPGLLTRLFRR